MKLQWSVFLLLLTVASCGSDEFGTASKTTKQGADALKSYTQSSCSISTLVKPKVDVLYLVDNSSSRYYIPEDIQDKLSESVDTLSKAFDYRVIGTPLLETANGNADYQVMTNSSDLTGIPSDGRRITSAGSFDFFRKSPTSGVERGLERATSFIDAHKSLLIRNSSYLIVVLISNGRDMEVEEDQGTRNGETRLNSIKYNERLLKFRELRTTLDANQLRLFSVTAKSVCGDGYRTALKSYVKISTDLYGESGARDNSTAQDSYNLCSTGGINGIFSAINSSIQQVVLPHEYRYWPITFAENNELVSRDELRVQRISPNGSSSVLTRDTDWYYEDLGSSQTTNLREGPNPVPGPGEPYTGRHLSRFANPIIYPDCVLVTSVSRTEYFGFIALPQKPRVETISVRINGRTIAKSNTNGWSDISATSRTQNIKVAYPAPGDENPPVIRTGFMLQLNGTANYYKSGDNLEVNYLPAGI